MVDASVPTYIGYPLGLGPEDIRNQCYKTNNNIKIYTRQYLGNIEQGGHFCYDVSMSTKLLPVYLAQALVPNKYHARLTIDQIRVLQQKKFRQLVKHAVQNSPYYQDLVRKYAIDVNSCRPEDFPILTKADVLEHFDQMVTDPRITKAKIAAFLEHSKDPADLFLGTYYVIHTSGSSGTVGYSLYTPQELARGIVHFTRMHPPSIGQTLAYIGAIQGHFAGATIVTAAKNIPFIYKKVGMFDINRPFQHIIQQLNELQPTSLSGYAFALRKLAEAQQAGELHISPRAIQSGGEQLSHADKAFIQEVFKTEVVNVYAASEHLIMGIGKDSFNGMYLMEDDLIFEPQPTRTCVTNLYNKTLPLIRYEMSDRLQHLPDTQHHLPFTKVVDIVGRNEHIPIFINDADKQDFISPILLSEFYVKHVTAFQFHILGQKEFIFKACLDTGLTDKEKQAVIQKIKQALGAILKEKQMTKVKFKVELVDRLWSDPKTGKFRLILKD